MSTNFKSQMKEVMNLAWQMVKKNGFSMSEALKTAWANWKIQRALTPYAKAKLTPENILILPP